MNEKVKIACSKLSLMGVEIVDHNDFAIILRNKDGYSFYDVLQNRICKEVFRDFELWQHFLLIINPVQGIKSSLDRLHIYTAKGRICNKYKNLELGINNRTDKDTEVIIARNLRTRDYILINKDGKTFNIVSYGVINSPFSRYSLVQLDYGYEVRESPREFSFYENRLLLVDGNLRVIKKTLTI